MSPFDPAGLKEKLTSIEEEMNKPGFWDDPESAQKYMKEKKSIEGKLGELDHLGSQLWAEIKHLVTSGENKKTFMFNVMSFGYKKGIPLAADMVFDMRFIPNPYYVKSLRPLTGNNAKVSQYVLKHEVTQDFLSRTLEMIHMLVPYYMKEGKYSLTICIGCTGGHHRSVAVANELCRRLKEDGCRTTLEHRDL